MPCAFIIVKFYRMCLVVGGGGGDGGGGSDSINISSLAVLFTRRHHDVQVNHFSHLHYLFAAQARREYDIYRHQIFVVRSN